MSFENLEGKSIPQIDFKVRENHKWLVKNTDDYFKNKKVVLFALPGAFTPTCSSTHLPRYQELFSSFRSLGVDEVICLSVNDTFVMNEWQRDQEAFDITMLPDGNADLSKALGMAVDKNDLGFGKRSWRYSMYVENGVIKKTFIEEEVPGDPFGNSDADTMIKFLDPSFEIPKSYAIFTRHGCEFCFNAKELLKKNNISFEEHVLGEDFSIKTLVAVSGTTKVPQVFANGERIGGFDQLSKVLK